MPEAIIPDTKDWTWVLERPCVECGFDPQAHTVVDLPVLVRDTATVWSQVLRRPDVRERPAPEVWSPLEYACHVRDVHQIFGERVTLMLNEDQPEFANWDQDETAIEARYADQDPAEVEAELMEAAAHVAGLYAGVTLATAGRRGFRSNGSVFTVETLGLYHLHDVVHHAHDVDAVSHADETVRAYDRDAAAYAANVAVMHDSVRGDIETFAGRLGAGARVLEIGSGGGRDAALMEELGLRVRRTDITPGFVALLRDQGHDADVIDPLHDDLSSPDGSYDAVWANASLLHVHRSDLPAVLARLAAVCRRDAVLRVAVKEGDGDGWSTHGSITQPRHFTYWRGDALRDVVSGAGWHDVHLSHQPGTKTDESWLEVWALRA